MCDLYCMFYCGIIHCGMFTVQATCYGMRRISRHLRVQRPVERRCYGNDDHMLRCQTAPPVSSDRPNREVTSWGQYRVKVPKVKVIYRNTQPPSIFHIFSFWIVSKKAKFIPTCERLAVLSDSGKTRVFQLGSVYIQRMRRCCDIAPKLNVWILSCTVTPSVSINASIKFICHFATHSERHRRGVAVAGCKWALTETISS